MKIFPKVESNQDDIWARAGLFEPRPDAIKPMGGFGAALWG